MGAEKEAVVFYDGHCMLCDTVVKLIARHDRKGIFRYAYLQSPAGERVRKGLQQRGAPLPDSVILEYGGRLYTRSGAVLKAAMLLGGAWTLLSIGYVLPSFMRNWLYDVVAGNRYKWFGSSETCLLPSQEFQSRMLKDGIPETL